MCCKVAHTKMPFSLRLDIALAVFHALFLNDSFAADAFFNYRLEISFLITQSSFFLHGKYPPIQYTDPHSSATTAEAIQAGAIANRGSVQP